MAASSETVPQATDIPEELHRVRQRLTELDITEGIGCFGRPGAQLEDKLEFKSKDGKSVWAYPVLVDFRRLLQLGQITENSGVIPGISNQQLLHAVVGLYDVCLSDMTADCIYDTICEKWARTIVLVQDLQDTIKDMTEHRKRKQEEAEKKKKEAEEKKKEAEEKKKEAEENKSNNESKEEKSEDESNNDDDDDDDDDDEDEDDDKEIKPEDDVLEEDDEKPSHFEDVFSDTDSEEEDDDEEEEDESDDDTEDVEESGDEEPNFSQGIHTFIKKAKQRRKERESCQDDPIKAEHISIENMLMGCASYEKKFVCQQKDRVIHLTFIGVRKRARKLQMGRYLLSKCLDPTIVGHYEAVVVHADHGAVDFFTKFGFTDDVLLNSKWSELAEQFTQCTLMSYLPGFSLTGTAMMEVGKTLKQDPEVGELEIEFKKWQQKSLEAYQSQVLCMKKMQHEILQLKCVMKKQTDLMDKLLEDNEMLRKSKLSSERDLLMYKLETARSAYKSVTSNGDIGEEVTGDDDISTDQLIQSLEQEVSSVNFQFHRLAQGTQPPLPSITCGEGHYVITDGHVRSQTAPYDHAEDVSVFSDIAKRFKEAMSADTSIRMQYDVSSIVKAVLPSAVQERFKKQVQGLRDPSMVTHLYYCGTLERPHRCQELLSAGFSTDDFSHGEYGHGLYFSKYPSKAAQFSALGKLMVVEVGLGEVETVTKEDRIRKAPSAGHDSIITPGRLYRGGGDSKEIALCQEYVVFHPAQVLPICLLTYQAVSP